MDCSRFFFMKSVINPALLFKKAGLMPCNFEAFESCHAFSNVLIRQMIESSMKFASLTLFDVLSTNRVELAFYVFPVRA